MRKPNKERIKLLVDTLRSKKYRQGRGALAVYNARHKKYYYCCLGVACEIARAGGVDVRITRDGEYRSYDGLFTMLPDSVRDFFGFDYNNPYLDLPDDSIVFSSTAITANDTLLLNFLEIADAFERTYLNNNNNNN